MAKIDFWQDAPELKEGLERVSALMVSTVRSPDFPLGESVAELLSSNGKMLRPALLLIGSRFGKPDRERTTALAAAIELLHVSTLIHDDVIDKADLRRGVPTLHTRFGNRDAVLAGDWLFSRCFRLASESAAPANARLLARLVGSICSAEIEQDLAAWTYSTSVRSYLRKIAGKTAALFALALHTGASESRTRPGVTMRLRRAGYDLGMAFQVMDDILDFESTEGAMRKPVGNDVKEGLCTLPLIYALRAEEAGMRALLARVPRPEAEPAGLGPEGPERFIAERDAAVAAVLSRTAELGGVEKARAVAERFTHRALQEIDRLPDKPARRELRSLTEKLLIRSH